MRLLSDMIIQPLISEKAAKMEGSFNEFHVLVDQKLTKPEIKQAVTKIFGIEPLSVRTVIFRKKSKRTKGGETTPKQYKKALIRLPEGKRIELK